MPVGKWQEADKVLALTLTLSGVPAKRVVARGAEKSSGGREIVPPPARRCAPSHTYGACCPARSGERATPDPPTTCDDRADAPQRPKNAKAGRIKQ